jgi:integral membrane protein (TIGR01906 family)
MLWSFINILRRFVIIGSIPFLILTTNIRCVINSEAFFSYGFEAYQVQEYTGIEKDQLEYAGNQIRSYFNNGEEFIAISVIKGGILIENLFSDREVLHMKDVKTLVKWVYRVQILSLISLIAAILAGFFTNNPRHLMLSLRMIGFSGGFTLVLFVLVAMGVAISFDKLFLLFHLISFRNDLWMLDPTQDYLIAMFPQGFFFTATILIASLTLLEAILIWLFPKIIGRFWKI